MGHKVTGFKRLAKAMAYSCQGLKAAWQHEAAIRQEIIAGGLAIVIALLLPVPVIAKLMMIGSVWLVFIVELINSAIESVVDRCGTDFHPLSGRAKDIASAAVLVTIILAVIIWLTLLCSFC